MSEDGSFLAVNATGLRDAPTEKTKGEGDEGVAAPGRVLDGPADLGVFGPFRTGRAQDNHLLAQYQQLEILPSRRLGARGEEQ